MILSLVTQSRFDWNTNINKFPARGISTPHCKHSHILDTPMINTSNNLFGYQASEDLNGEFGYQASWDLNITKSTKDMIVELCMKFVAETTKIYDFNFTSIKTTISCHVCLISVLVDRENVRSCSRRLHPKFRSQQMKLAVKIIKFLVHCSDTSHLYTSSV